MSEPVFVISEWLPKEGCDQEVVERLKSLMDMTRTSEKGCVQAYAFEQIAHPKSPGTSKYKIVLFQEYKALADFNTHTEMPYVKEFVKTYIEHPETAIIQDGTCRLFRKSDNEIKHLC